MNTYQVVTLGKMSQEEWNQVKGENDGLRSYFLDIWYFDRTVEIISTEVEEIDQGIAASVVYRVSSQIFCQTVLGGNTCDVFRSLRRCLLGHAEEQHVYNEETSIRDLDKKRKMN